jgi:hypothetical protein
MKAFLFILMIFIFITTSFAQEKDSILEQPKKVYKNQIGIDLLGNIGAISYARIMKFNEKFDYGYIVSTRPFGNFFFYGEYVPNLNLSLWFNLRFYKKLTLFNESGIYFLSTYYPIIPTNASDYPFAIGALGFSSSLGVLINKERISFAPAFPTLLYGTTLNPQEEDGFLLDKLFALTIGSRISYKF